jgi:predicted methyltransferase
LLNSSSELEASDVSSSIDLAFITDTYHHFEYPQQTQASIHQALRSDGRVIIIDFRRDPRISSNWVMGHVRGDQAQVIQELHAAGFRLVDDKPLMRTNYFLEFIKAGKRERSLILPSGTYRGPYTKKQ